ncbi:MmcQ/YjbR family DNA-binding protein [Oryzobacter terrae]|uniref:MmcQ/YjbR family DNA-binding protein n=1 Tax=Oryzobacter terrae TaxID=1620385 RepID=UPI00366EA55B
MSPEALADGDAAQRLAAHALGKPGARADQPWEGDHVAKVGEKIFAFLGEGGVGVKCGKGRTEADEWLAEYPDDASVMAYIGRNGWNTLRVGGAIPEGTLREAIDTSYDLVVAGLPRSRRPAGGSAG